MSKLYIVVYDENEWPMETLYFATNNEGHKNVLVINEEELVILQNGRALEIIDKINDSTIRDGDDDWIPMNDAKNDCFNALYEYCNEISNDEEKKIVIKIRKMLELSLNSNEAVCFHYQ